MGLLLVGSMLFLGCSSGAASTTGQVTLRLGYFPNLTHAPAMVGLESGLVAKALGANVTIDAKVFNAGPDEVEALLAGSLDAGFMGPNPAINAFVRSKGQAIRIVSGATSGGAALVVSAAITSPADLRGKTLSSPELGNTQDVALRTWLAAQGYRTDQLGGGDVKVLPQANAQTLTTFKAGQIAGAWVPEPWASRMVLEGNGHVLVNEADLWPNGQFVTTHLVVSTTFLTAHPDVVEHLIAGEIAAVNLIGQDPTRAQELTQATLERLTGQRLKPDVLARAWSQLSFTNDPIASSLVKSAQNSQALGLIPSTALGGIYDLGPLNRALQAAGKPVVATPNMAGG